LYLERLEDLSVYYWLIDKFADAPFINIEDGFPNEDLTIPTISVEVDVIDTTPGELGNRKRIKLRVWYIDIFAHDKSQRDEYAYRVLNELESNIPVYDYDEGFPPDVSPSQIGCLIPEQIKVEVIKIMPALVDKLYYRSTVSFMAIYSRF